MSPAAPPTPPLDRSATAKLRTSQLVLPQNFCETVYATEGYEASVSNLAQVSLDSDGIFQ